MRERVLRRLGGWGASVSLVAAVAVGAAPAVAAPGPGAEAGAGPGQGLGAGLGSGSGHGPGSGPGPGPGPGSGPASGHGPGSGQGTGSGPGARSGHGSGSGQVAGSGPEADLAYHGAAAMAGGLVDLRLTPGNRGPAAVPDATVRLRWSEPLADRQELAAGCARSAARVVLCRVGALAVDGPGERIALRVRLREAPAEVLLEIDTVWQGGPADDGPAGPRQRVLVLDTGDEYYF